jgi:uncharacterized protein YndB with AHSA1/START domain
VTNVGELQIEVWFKDPPAVVFAAWIEPDQLACWFAALDWQVERVHFEPIAGSRWYVDFRHPDGTTYQETGIVRRVEFPTLLEFTLTQVGLPTAAVATLVTVQFSENRGGTLLQFRQTGFTSPTWRDSNRDGWNTCFEKLRRFLNTRGSAARDAAG